MAPLSQQYAQQFQAWQAAGGPEDNFRAHALATIDALKPTNDDIAFLVQHARGALVQLELAVAKANGPNPKLTPSVVVVYEAKG